MSTRARQPVEDNAPDETAKRQHPFVFGLLVGLGSALGICLVIVELTVGVTELFRQLSPTKTAAAKSIDRVIFKSPEAADAGLTHSRCAKSSEYYENWSLGNFAKAVDVLDQCGPRPNPWILKEKANCKIAMYQMDEAENDLRAAAECAYQHLSEGDPEYLPIWQAIARKRIKIFRDEAEVLQEAVELIKVHDRLPEIWHIVGLCHWYSASTLEDQSARDEKLTVDERHARLTAAEDHWRQAQLAYKNSIERGSKNYWTWIDYLNCRAQLGAKEDELSKEFIEAMKKFPDNLEVEARFRLRWRPHEFGPGSLVK